MTDQPQVGEKEKGHVFLSYHFTTALVELLDRLIELLDRERHIDSKCCGESSTV